MQLRATSCNFVQLHATSCNFVQTYWCSLFAVFGNQEPEPGRWPPFCLETCDFGRLGWVAEMRAPISQTIVYHTRNHPPRHRGPGAGSCGVKCCLSCFRSLVSVPWWGLCGSLTSLAILTYSRAFDIKTSNRQGSFVNWVADPPAKRRRTIQKFRLSFLGVFLSDCKLKRAVSSVCLCHSVGERNCPRL